jgi:hypothetical protein
MYRSFVNALKTVTEDVEVLEEWVIEVDTAADLGHNNAETNKAIDPDNQTISRDRATFNILQHLWLPQQVCKSVLTLYKLCLSINSSSKAVQCHATAKLK